MEEYERICFNIVTHNRREDFNKLIKSIQDRMWIFDLYNVDVIIVDAESDVPAPKRRGCYTLHRRENQLENHGLIGSWDFIVQNYINSHKWFVFSNHDVILNNSIAQFFKGLRATEGPFVMGPTSNPGGANLYQCTTEPRNRYDIPYQIVEKQPKRQPLVHGFFWGTNRYSLELARWEKNGMYFNPEFPFAGSEDDWQLRLLNRDKRTRFLLETTTYVHHEHYSDWRKL